MDDDLQKPQEIKTDSANFESHRTQSTLWHKKHRKLVVATAIPIAVFAGFAVFMSLTDNNNRDQNLPPEEKVMVQEESPADTPKLIDESGRAVVPADCLDKKLVFTHDLVAPKDRKNITGAQGYGGTGVPGHVVPSDHGGTGLADRTYRMPIYMPATANLTTLNFQDIPGEGTNGAMYFSICGETTMGGISFSFGHLSELSGEIMALTGCEVATSCTWGTLAGDRNPPVEVLSGTLLGYVGGPAADSAYGFDFGVKDITKAVDMPGGFAVWGSLLHSSCAFDYFEDASTKKFYYDLMKAQILREPYCGTINLYVPGTLAGIWFDPDTPWPTDGANEYKHVSFSYSTTTLDKDFIMNATIRPEGGGYFVVRETGQVNRAAKDITADGNKYCIEKAYSHPNTINPADILPGVIVLQMNTDTDLVAEMFSFNSCPDDVNNLEFTNNAKKFERFKRDWQFTEGF